MTKNWIRRYLIADCCVAVLADRCLLVHVPGDCKHRQVDDGTHKEPNRVVHTKISVGDPTNTSLLQKGVRYERPHG